MSQILYARPRNASELFEIMEMYGEKACVYAGGTDVAVNLRSGRISPEVVIQLQKVCELSSEIIYTGHAVKIGALATLSEIVKHREINRLFSALSQAADCVGSKQIRNIATLAGNICNASPAADTAPPLLLYKTTVNLLSKGGYRVVPIEDFFVGPRKTLLRKNEIVESISIYREKEECNSAYLRMSRRRGVDLSSLGVGVLSAESGEVRVALGAVGPRPFRAYKAESMLYGKLNNKSAVDEAMNILETEVNPISDIRASGQYRIEMAKEYTRRAIDSVLRTSGR